jgi:alkyl hydroperoxide reductase subunit AhpC
MFVFKKGEIVKKIAANLEKVGRNGSSTTRMLYATSAFKALMLDPQST